MKHAVIITAANFQDEELIYPYYRMLEEGYRVDIATPGKENVTGKYGVPSRPSMDTMDLRTENYDLVVIPGGFEAPDRLRIRKEVLVFVREMFEQRKLIATICHGPWVCISAGIMRGRKATGFIAIKDDIINAGAEYIDQDVVVDDNLISSPHYRNNGDFMRAVVAYFCGVK